MRGVAVSDGFRLDAAASCQCLNPHHGHFLAASWRSVVAFRAANCVGSHNPSITGLNHTACSLVVYASQLSFLASQSYGHARLTSSWWSTLAGWDWLPTRSLMKFPSIYI
jgi:hypothetical protein